MEAELSGSRTLLVYDGGPRATAWSSIVTLLNCAVGGERLPVCARHSACPQAALTPCGSAVQVGAGVLSFPYAFRQARCAAAPCTLRRGSASRVPPWLQVHRLGGGAGGDAGCCAGRELHAVRAVAIRRAHAELQLQRAGGCGQAVGWCACVGVRVYARVMQAARTHCCTCS